MRSREFANEAKKSKLTMPKQRDPNWKTLQAKGTSGASGRHKDKKKAAKQGEVKHKGQVAEAIGDEPDEQYLDKVISDLHKDALGFRPDREFGQEWMSSSFEEKLKIYNNLLKSLHSDIDESVDELYGMRVGDTVTTKINGQTVQGDIIDLFPDDMQVELLLKGGESGRTVVVDVRNTEFFEDSDSRRRLQVGDHISWKYMQDKQFQIGKVIKARGLMVLVRPNGKEDTVKLDLSNKSLSWNKMAPPPGRTVGMGRIEEGIEELEARRDELERVLKKAREITTAIKYENTVGEIIAQIQELAESIGVADELKYPINDVYEAQSQLQSAVYGLDEVFEEALRNVSYEISDMEEEEYDRNNRFGQK